MMLNILPPHYISATLVLLSGVLFSTSALTKTSPFEELKQTGLYGRVHAWQNVARKAHNIPVKVPSNAPIIVSDYHSPVGANGLKRTGTHNGVDIYAAIGSPIIAAADGRVLKAKVDRCWGPTILMSHGLDKENKPIYALYGHVRNFKVKVGQRVKRGQQIAEMGNDIFTGCGAGFHHLHFQISYNPHKIPFGWGWSNYVSDGWTAPNPHEYWTNGSGNITCFEEGRKYEKSGFTYPLPCKNKQRRPNKVVTIVAKKQPTQPIPSATQQQAAVIDLLNKDLALATEVYKRLEQEEVLEQLNKSIAATKQSTYTEDSEAEHMNRLDQEFMSASAAYGFSK